MNLIKTITCLAIALAIWVNAQPSHAAPNHAIPRPVRIAIVAATGSGIEQQVVDGLSAQLQEDPNIVISTVNPDWQVTCRIEDHTDIQALTVRVNGTVTIKTVNDGAVLNTISAQANKQDFSTGGPTPLNKALVTSAMNQVVQDLTQRSVQPIESAVVVEIETRDKLMKAKELAHEDKYDDALAIVTTITRDSPRFWPAHTLADQIEMEKESLRLVTLAKANARQGQYGQAIAYLRQVSAKSKRYRAAQGLITSFSQPTLAKNKTAANSGTQSNANAQLKALETEKRALDARRKSIEAQEAVIRSNR